MKFGFWTGKDMLMNEFSQSRIGEKAWTHIDRDPKKSLGRYPYSSGEILIKPGDLIIIDDKGYPFNDLKYLGKYKKKRNPRE